MLIVMFRASELGGLQDTSSARPSLTPSVLSGDEIDELISAMLADAE
jgi:hypothetical protein